MRNTHTLSDNVGSAARTKTTKRGWSAQRTLQRMVPLGVVLIATLLGADDPKSGSRSEPAAKSVWSDASNAFGSEVLEGWSRRAGATGIQMLRPVARRLASQGERRKKSDEVSLPSVPVERISNPIKAMKRQD